jgi:hypothetical protein
MTDTFRALCAEIAEQLDGATDPDDLGIRAARIVAHIRAELAQPKVMSPSYKEIIGCMYKGAASVSRLEPVWISRHTDEIVAGVLAVLSRWGSDLPYIPVSEGQPGPEDCDKEGRCWWFNPGQPASSNPHIATSSWRLTHMIAGKPMGTHWLPAHILVLPTTDFNHD